MLFGIGISNIYDKMVKLKSENYNSLGILTDNSDFYFEDVSEIDNTENSIWGKLFL